MTISYVTDANRQKTIRVTINFPEVFSENVKVGSCVQFDIFIDYDSNSGNNLLNAAFVRLINWITIQAKAKVTAFVIVLAGAGVVVLGPAATVTAVAGSLLALLGIVDPGKDEDDEE